MPRVPSRNSGPKPKRKFSLSPGKLGAFLPGVAAFAALALLFTLASARAQQTNTSQPPPPPPPAPAPETKPGAPSGASSDSAPLQSGFTIRRDSNLVVLHASVLDEQGKFVPGLKAEDFHVAEDGVAQKISVFSQDDVPVSMGLVIDNSESMFEKQPQVNAAALTFIKTSNPQDEAFLANFNDVYHLDADFTGDIDVMRAALGRIDARGTTALYDAVLSSLDYLKRGYKDKKVLLVITDGVDNSSRATLQNAVEQAQRTEALVYAIGLFNDDDFKRNPRAMEIAKKALTAMSTATGGSEYFPDSVSDTESICTQIAYDIRHQYTLAYVPTNEAHDGTFRLIQLTVSAPGAGKLAVRTRTGRFAPRGTSSAN